MRDTAIVRATLRELGPLLLGTLALGLLVAMAGIDARNSGPRLDGANTWPLVVLPLAALWGGLAVGGGSRATLVYLLARPIPRLRILAWRWALLIGGLAIVGVVLLWVGHQLHGRGPDPLTIAMLTVLLSIFGAQGGALSDRELYSLGGAMMLCSAAFVPVELGLEAWQITWSRVHATLGWGWLAPFSIACVLFSAPVIAMWKRALPMRGVEAATRLVLTSLGAALAFVVGVAWPTVAWVGAAERGQLIAVVAVSEGRPIVATGTIGEDGRRDVVDALVRIDEDGERHVIWDRRDESRDITVWRIAVPETMIAGPFGDTIQIAVVDGAEPDFLHPLETIEVRVDLDVEQLAKSKLDAPTYGRPGSSPLVVRGHSVWVKESREREKPLGEIRPTEIAFMRDGAHAVGAGRIWAVNRSGKLWSAPVPWEVTR